MTTVPQINRYAFEATNNLHRSIVSMHDFILPASTALWQFRKVIIDEYRDFSRPKMIDYLYTKYNTAPGTRASTNLITPFVKHTWEMQRDRLAEITLINIIAIYEFWCDEICSVFGRPQLANRLQFPSNAAGTNGILSVLTEMKTNNISPMMRKSVYPGLIATGKYSLATLNNLLKCFRYFKELRNCLMHRGRICDQRLCYAQRRFVSVADKGSLGMGFVPDYHLATIGHPVEVQLHGSLGFTDVILRIVTTIDAELSETVIGEESIIRRMADYATLPIEARKINMLLRTMGLRDVKIDDKLIRLLWERGVLRDTFYVYK
jgi:hypothetical protein